MNLGNLLNLNKNELQNARIQNLASDPASPVVGQMYFNTVTNKLRIYNGATWDEYGTGVGSGDVSSNTGTSVDGEIALFNGTTGKSIKRATTTGVLKATSGVLAAAVAGTDYTTPSSTESFTNKTFNANGTGNSITNLEVADFAANVVDNDNTLAANSSTRIPTQAAVKGYVDNLIAGLDWKDSVRVATTTNGTLASAFANGQTVDGVVLATNDRILLKNQSTQTENGIYIVQASGAPVRASDADSGAELLGAAVLVREGTANANTNWVNSNTTAITLGSTNVTFVQFRGQVEASASTTVSGIVELATQAETEAKTDTVRAVTPASLATFTQKRTFNIGNGSATTFTCTHNLNTSDIVVSIRKVSNGEQWLADVDITGVNACDIIFGAYVPTTNEFTVTVIG